MIVPIKDLLFALILRLRVGLELHLLAKEHELFLLLTGRHYVGILACFELSVSTKTVVAYCLFLIRRAVSQYHLTIRQKYRHQTIITNRPTMPHSFHLPLYPSYVCPGLNEHR